MTNLTGKIIRRLLSPTETLSTLIPTLATKLNADVIVMAFSPVTGIAESGAVRVWRVVRNPERPSLTLTASRNLKSKDMAVKDGCVNALAMELRDAAK